MSAKRRLLWASALVPWLVGALVWGLVQQVRPPSGPEDSPSAAEQVGVAEPERDHGPDPARQVAARAPDWAAVLDRLDRRRAQAYEVDDRFGLRDIYVAGSTVLRRDLAMLAAYRKREVRLTGVRLRVLAVRSVGRTGPYVQLRVVDRLERPTAHTANGTARLPRDHATERLIVLRDTTDGWRIAAVRRV